MHADSDHGPADGETFADFLAREDAELRAEVERQVQFLEEAELADVPEVVAMLRDLVVGETGDPRINAGIGALCRLFGKPSA